VRRRAWRGVRTPRARARRFWLAGAHRRRRAAGDDVRAAAMITFYYWPTTNCHKVAIFLHEASLAHTIHPVDIGRGEQFAEDFLAVSPNNKVPAIIDHAPADGGEAVPLFESAAILQYLADKTGHCHPATLREREAVRPWLFWQVGHLGPMLGQSRYFSEFAPEKIPHAIERYKKETARLYGVLEKRLEGRDYIAADYSIADIACYPWAALHETLGQAMEPFPNVRRWLSRIAARPAVISAYAMAAARSGRRALGEEAKKILFGF
jgi:GST-like protein